MTKFVNIITGKATEDETKAAMTELRHELETFNIDNWFDAVLAVSDDCPETFGACSWAATTLGDMSLDLPTAMRLSRSWPVEFQRLWNETVLATAPAAQALNFMRVLTLKALQCTAEMLVRS